MKKPYFLAMRYFFALLTCLILVDCSSSKFPVSEGGVIQAQQDNMNKDAVRVKVRVLSKNKPVGDRNSYTTEIIEVLDHGNTFARVEPQPSERVILYTPSNIRFKKNTEVLLDVLSPINRGEVLELNMVVEN